MRDGVPLDPASIGPQIECAASGPFGPTRRVAVVVSRDLCQLLVQGLAVARIHDHGRTDRGPVEKEALCLNRNVDAAMTGVLSVLRTRAPTAWLPGRIVQTLAGIREPDDHLHGGIGIPVRRSLRPRRMHLPG